MLLNVPLQIFSELDFIFEHDKVRQRLLNLQYVDLRAEDVYLGLDFLALFLNNLRVCVEHVSSVILVKLDTVQIFLWLRIGRVDLDYLIKIC